MLKLNCQKVLNSRGIHDHRGHLRQNGFTYHKIYRITGNKRLRTISLDVLEKLCLTLNCTPNDLMDWTPDKGEQDTELTALQALKPGINADYNTLLSRLPFDKLSEIVKAVSETQKK